LPKREIDSQETYWLKLEERKAKLWQCGPLSALSVQQRGLLSMKNSGLNFMKYPMTNESTVTWTFGKQDTIAMYVYTKIYGHYLPGTSVSWTLLPEFSVEYFRVFQKFINFQISWKLSQGLISVTIF